MMRKLPIAVAAAGALFAAQPAHAETQSPTSLDHHALKALEARATRQVRQGAMTTVLDALISFKQIYASGGAVVPETGGAAAFDADEGTVVPQGNLERGIVQSIDATIKTRDLTFKDVQEGKAVVGVITHRHHNPRVKFLQVGPEDTVFPNELDNDGTQTLMRISFPNGNVEQPMVGDLRPVLYTEDYSDGQPVAVAKMYHPKAEH